MKDRLKLEPPNLGEDRMRGNRMAKFEVYLDESGEYRFRLRARNGQIIAVSQGYKSKEGCMRGIRSVKANAPTARIILLEEEPEIKKGFGVSV